jgi:hypothetical protein
MTLCGNITCVSTGVRHMGHSAARCSTPSAQGAHKVRCAQGSVSTALGASRHTTHSFCQEARTTRIGLPVLWAGWVPGCCVWDAVAPPTLLEGPALWAGTRRRCCCCCCPCCCCWCCCSAGAVTAAQVGGRPGAAPAVACRVAAPAACVMLLLLLLLLLLSCAGGRPPA